MPQFEDVASTNPLATLGLNREIVREFKDNPEGVLALAKALYRAQSQTTHSDKGGSDVSQAELNAAHEALQDPEMLRLSISEYVTVTNLQGELDQAKRGLELRRREVQGLGTALVGLIESSARASLGLEPRGATADTLQGCVIRLLDEGLLLRTGQIIAGDGHQVTELDGLRLRRADLAARGKSAESLAALDQRIGAKEALSQRTVSVSAEGIIQDSATKEPRTPAVALIIPWNEIRQGTDLATLLTRVGLRINPRLALTAGSEPSSGTTTAEHFNTTAIPPETLGKLGRYLSKGLSSAGPEDRVYLISSYSVGEAGDVRFYLEGKVEEITVGDLKESSSKSPSSARPSTESGAKSRAKPRASRGSARKKEEQ